MARNTPEQKGHQIPETFFRDVVSHNPWRVCAFYRQKDEARTIDDAVASARQRSGVLPSAQEFAAYVLSGGRLDGHNEYWLRTMVYASHLVDEPELSVCDESDPINCPVFQFASELGVGHLRGYLARPRRANGLLEQVRLKSALEDRKMCHGGYDTLHVDLAKESDVETLARAEQWRVLFGVLGRAFAKRVYRQRTKQGLSSRVTFQYPARQVLFRDRLSSPEGLRGVRVSNIDSEQFIVRLDGSFREQAGVIAVCCPQDFYKWE